MDDALLTQFTHLQVHSHFSLLGGTASVQALAQLAAAQGMKALALTDTAVLYGVVSFSQACAAAGIQPIVGMTVPVASPPPDVHTAVPAPGRIVLLATGPAGYRSLCRLSSAVQGRSDREDVQRRGVEWDLLKAHRTGVICLEGGRMGWLSRFAQAGNHQAATRYAARLGGIYAEHAYLGLEIHRPQDESLARELVQLGSRFGLAAVALQPVYCLQPAQRSRLRLLAAIDQNCHLEMVPVVSLPALGDTAVPLHWQSPQAVAETYQKFPEAVQRVGEIVSQCQPSLPDGRPIWPALDLPEGQTVEAALTEAAEAGLRQRITDSEKRRSQYADRLQQELAAIIEYGFAPLFLLVADVTRFARETAVPVNTRGSVANSLVAYSLGITTVDPIAHDLLFERFLNPARSSLPDIDLDFCSRRRDEVLRYVRRKYGEERVALVATISTLQPKSAVRETAKAYGYDEAASKKLTALVPRRWHPDPRRRGQMGADTILDQLDAEQEKEIMATAFDLVGQPHHLSIHPGGLVITPGPLTDWVPVQLAPKGFLTTQYDFRDVEKIGLPKIDLLGIRALTVLADTAELVRQHHDPDFDLTTIPLDDAETAVHIARGETIGVFQCESTGAQRTLRQLQAGSVRDLAVANAFFKPGPALGGMAQAFIRRYRGQEQVTFLHSALEPILGATQGVLLFQEQVLRIATEVASLTWAEADRLRRGMSKFQAKEMAAIRLRFVTGCREKSGFTPKQADTLWEQIEPFAGYGFNRGHATAYADVSYRSAYLKTHYPAEFLCARLADHGGFHHPAIYIAEARRLGIPVRPPHVNFSQRKVTLTYGEIRDWRLTEPPITNHQSPILWLGLGQVRDLRRRSIQAILTARAEAPFDGLRDLLARVPLQNKEITHLIQCGALDGLAESRTALLAEAEEVNRAGSARQMAFSFVTPTAVAPETAAQQLAWEKRILGLPVSANPITLVAEQAEDDVPLRFVYRLLNLKTTVAGVRLPGWTGGKGFFLADGDSFVVVKPKFRRKIAAWQPLRLSGCWREDEWGSGWFETDTAVTLKLD